LITFSALRTLYLPTAAEERYMANDKSEIALDSDTIFFSDLRRKLKWVKV